MKKWDLVLLCSCVASEERTRGLCKDPRSDWHPWSWSDRPGDQRLPGQDRKICHGWRYQYATGKFYSSRCPVRTGETLHRDWEFLFRLSISIKVEIFFWVWEVFKFSKWTGEVSRENSRIVVSRWKFSKFQVDNIQSGKGLKLWGTS